MSDVQRPLPPVYPPAAPGRMAATVFALLVLATLGAFFIATQLKARPPVLTVLESRAYFSPNGDGIRDWQVLTLKGDVSDEDATAAVVDGDGVRVATVGEGLKIRPGKPFRVRWGGRNSDGRVAPDGPYRVRVTLGGDGRTLMAPRRFFLDTEPPDARIDIRRRDVVVRPGQPVRFAVSRIGSRRVPRFRVVRTDIPEQRVVATFRGAPAEGSARWDGRTDTGKPASPGTYLIEVNVRDTAGNLARVPVLPARRGGIPGKPGFTVRDLAVQPPVRPVRAGAMSSVRVDARGAGYGWSLRKAGASRVLDRSRRVRRSSTLAVRVPREGTGIYLLTVSSRGRKTTVPLTVQGRGSSALTVVLPMVTWLGMSPVQDAANDDGLPDTLLNGPAVPYPRVFGFPRGLPPGFGDDVAPLIVWLERNEIDYRLTTDLDLELTGAPKAGGDGGLLFVGSPRWVSAGLGRRLRSYVEQGGRVALLGGGSLRAGVTVAEGELTRPSAPAPRDALGGRLAKPRPLAPPGSLSVVQDTLATGLLTGFSGTLTDVGRVEELADPGEAETVAALAQPLTEAEAADAESAGVEPRPERPAYSVLKQGSGLVARVGIDGWVARLAADDPAVEQLTRNLVDVLRGERPRPRTASG